MLQTGVGHGTVVALCSEQPGQPLAGQLELPVAQRGWNRRGRQASAHSCAGDRRQAAAPAVAFEPCDRRRNGRTTSPRGQHSPGPNRSTADGARQPCRQAARWSTRVVRCQTLFGLTWRGRFLQPPRRATNALGRSSLRVGHIGPHYREFRGADQCHLAAPRRHVLLADRGRGGILSVFPLSPRAFRRYAHQRRTG